MLVPPATTLPRDAIVQIPRECCPSNAKELLLFICPDQLLAHLAVLMPAHDQDSGLAPGLAGPGYESC